MSGRVWLHRYARLLVVVTLLLVAAGGMVTSTNSGLSVPDWPTTFGRQMFAYPLSAMTGGIVYEHGHRLIASSVGFLTIGLVLFLWRVEPRTWVRRLGWVALGAVIAQGVLGGLTVLFLLPDAISISHAGLAQLFFCLTVSVALFTSPTWIRPKDAPLDDPGLRQRMVILTALIYVQILLGATMRHTGGGLAIPDFPLSFGHVIPPFWNQGIALHFAHRVGALGITIFVMANTGTILMRHSPRADLTRPAWLLLLLVLAQVTLGAFVCTERQAARHQHAARGHRGHATRDVALHHTQGVSSTLRDTGPRLMKPDTVLYGKPDERTTSRSRLADVLVLAKPRLNTLVVATTAGGYYMASHDAIDFSAMAVTCLATALVAAGASAINQVDERDTDRLMDRTRQRPLADGRMSAAEGRVIALALAGTGLLILWFATNAAATLVAVATLVSYALIYTPLKRRTSLSTVVGAVPGALPPLIGWAAVQGSVSSIEPWTLFVIMFLWQLPHFLAIAWIYREDYARAGLPMLSVVDKNGGFVGRQAALWAATLVAFSQLPFLFHLTDGKYAIGAIVLGLAQFVIAFNFARHRSMVNARLLFYTSIIYLPLLWTLMAIGRR